MLIYDPALDSYHTAIRILSILDKNIEGLEIDLVRILDFYLAYPSKVQEIRLPTQFRYAKKEAGRINTVYRKPPSGKTQFERMKPVFVAALHGLVAAGFLNTNFIKNGILLINFEKIPTDLRIAMQAFVSRQQTIKTFIIESLPTISLYGAGGLKERTGLLDFKYDIV